MSRPTPSSERVMAFDHLVFQGKLLSSHCVDTTPLFLDAAKGPLGSPALDLQIQQAFDHGCSDRQVAGMIDRHINPCIYRPC